MPRFYFNTVDGHRDDDTEGTELPDDGIARATAVVYAGEILSDQPDLLEADKCFAVEVTGEGGRLLFSVVTRVEEPRGPTDPAQA